MTTTQANTVSFYHERAAQLAIVYLTRRDDLRVQNPLPDMGIDLFVSLLKNEKATGRFWGIVTKGVAKTRTKPQTDLSGNSLLRDAPFPVCEFVFAMDTDVGFWRWVQMPNANERTRLVWNPSPDLLPLNNAALEAIRQTVDLWYEQRK